jgi:Flp pilus assembly pilin Flp
MTQEYFLCRSIFFMFHRVLARPRRALDLADRGQGMVEYSLIITFVAIVAIAGLIVLGPAIRDFFPTITASI